MRKHGKSDANQAVIVKALRQAGCSVLVMSGQGRGAPDIAVGRTDSMRYWKTKEPYRFNYFLEIKTRIGLRNPKVAPLTPDEEKWHRAWRGQVAIVSTVQEAFEAVGLEVAK